MSLSSYRYELGAQPFLNLLCPTVKCDEECPTPQFPKMYHAFAQRSLLFLLGVAALRELEVDIATGETAVDLGIGVEAVVDTNALLLVKDHLEELATVLLGADALANNLNGEAEIS